MNKIAQTLFLLIILSFSLKAQEEANIWYFGGNAGIDFNNGSPIPLTDGALFQHEGCATISDSLGNLLFYTNGIDVWNKNHMQMQNGFGLMGGQSATQSSVIVQQPENDHIFYIFTVPEEIVETGLRYSIVNLSKDGGLGSVTTKNIFLLAPTEEKVTAVKHHNNRDVWVITHLWNSKAFYAYLITPSGINPTPIISEVGSYHSGGDVHGSMKVSPNGKKLAIINRDLKNVELYDFDNKTGDLSNYLPFNAQFKHGYGIEFSQDASLLYVSDYYKQRTITQFDLNAGTNSEIIESGIEIGVVSNIHLGALQMGPDGKIYVAKHDDFLGDNYLGIINKPEIRGVECSFVEDGLFLGGRVCFWGLPTFVQSYFYQSQSIISTNNCIREFSYFSPSNLQDLDSVLWNFGDQYTDNNESRKINTVHIYTKAGDYQVQLISYFKDNIDTSYFALKIFSMPEVDLGLDAILLYDEYNLLDAGPGYDHYLWNNGSTYQTLRAYEQGLYWVIASVDQCKKSDSIWLYRAKCDIVFPTVFSPNGDGISDTYSVTPSEPPSRFEMSIYNLWGVELFKTNDVHFQWDGTWKGTVLPSGIYVYRCKYSCANNSKSELMTGYIEIFR